MERWDLEDFKDVARSYMSTYPERKKGWEFRAEPMKPGSMGQLLRYEGKNPWGEDMHFVYDVY